MKVVFSAKAKSKLLSIYYYIAHEQQAPENAERLINQIKEQSQLLSVTPKIGTSLHGENKRFIVIKNHVLVYEIQKETVLIMQVYGKGENWRK